MERSSVVLSVKDPLMAGTPPTSYERGEDGGEPMSHLLQNVVDDSYTEVVEEGREEQEESTLGRLMGHERAKLFFDFTNIFKSYIGSNVLSLPFAFACSGWGAGVILLFTVSLVTDHCVKLLLRVKHHLETKDGCDLETYGAIGEKIFHVQGRYICNFCLIVTQFGFCCGYLVFLGHTLHSLFPRFAYVFCVAVFVPPLILMAWIRRIRNMGPFSFLANVFLTTSFVLCTIHLVDCIRDGTPHVDTVRWTGIPIFFGIAASAFEGIGLVITIEHSIKEDRNRFTRLLDVSLLLITCLLFAFGILGYLTFGRDTESVITVNFASGSYLNLVKVFILIAILFTYPMQLMPVTDVTEAYCVAEGHESLLKRRFIRTCLVLATASTAIAIPNFGLLVSFVGSLGAAMLAFILPSVFHSYIFWSTLRPLIRVKNVLVITFGVCGAIIGMVVSMRDIVEELK